MSGILKIKDENGNWIDIPAIKGEDGKSAYDQAVEGGFAGTEQEFIQLLSSIGAMQVQLAGLDDEEPSQIETHIADKSNPHQVTKVQVGLGNVDNTSDANKPVSTAQATAIADAKKAGTDAQSNLTAHINNGAGTSSKAGHLKITDSYATSSSDTAASTKALNDAIANARTQLEKGVFKLIKTQAVNYTRDSSSEEVRDNILITDVDLRAYDEIIFEFNGTMSFTRTTGTSGTMYIGLSQYNFTDTSNVSGVIQKLVQSGSPSATTTKTVNKMRICFEKFECDTTMYDSRGTTSETYIGNLKTVSTSDGNLYYSPLTPEDNIYFMTIVGRGFKGTVTGTISVYGKVYV